MLDRFKQFIKDNESEIVLLGGVALISLISFAAGRLTASPPLKQPVRIEYLDASSFKYITSTSSLQAVEEKSAGKFVASKNSTKYHLPDCPGVRRIAEHNKIWFSSKEEAESLGYQPASNCPGL